MNQIYLETARLLTQVAPLVFKDDTFALKGGTAINLFVRDMPRLSVDLDLVFPDHTLPRDEALARINAAVRLAAERLTKRGFQTYAPASAAGETKLLVRRASIQVKIEVNFVMRGTVQRVRRASLTRSARDTLMADLDIPVVSLEDVYGSKLVAALDRQHPRDLFDVMQLLAHEGITPGIRCGSMRFSLRGNAWCSKSSGAWTTATGASCYRWLAARPSGRCWASLTLNICLAFAGNCATSRSCREPMRRNLPSKPNVSRSCWRTRTERSETGSAAAP